MSVLNITSLRQLSMNVRRLVYSSNPDPLHFAHADIIVAPVIEARGFRVRVPGHLLRDLDAATIREVVRDPRGTEGVA
jgi:hypothetical protein